MMTATGLPFVLSRYQPTVSPMFAGGRKKQAESIHTYQVKDHLQKLIRALGPDFAQADIIDRWYRHDTLRREKNLVYFDWQDRASTSGMLPEKVAEALKRIPGLKPAAKAINKLMKAGYNEGFPNPENFIFAVNPLHQDELKKTLKPGEFYKNTFAFSLPGTSKLSPQRTYLIAANINDGDYHDDLSYLDVATAALERRLRSLGVPNARPSDRLANYPGFSTESIGEGPFKDYSKPTHTLLIDYKNPAEYLSPTEEQVKQAVAQMPELVPASQVVAELKESKYDGYYERGQYPAELYALDLTRLPGFKADAQYQRYVLVEVYNSSEVTVPTEDELELAAYLRKRFKERGVQGGGIDIRSDNGPAGPNYLSITYNGYHPSEDLVMEAIARIPELISKSKSPSETTGEVIDGMRAVYSLDVSMVKELAHLSQKTIPVRLFENITDGY